MFLGYLGERDLDKSIVRTENNHCHIGGDNMITGLNHIASVNFEEAIERFLLILGWLMGVEDVVAAKKNAFFPISGTQIG